MSMPAAHFQHDLRRWQMWSLIAGLVALAISIVGAWFDPAQFFRAYLAAYLFYWGLGLGGMALVMLYQLTGGAWGYLIRRLLEAQMRTIPVLAILFAPIAFGVRYLYLWAQPDVVATDKHLQYQQFYLNPTFFWIRAGVCFVVWMAMAYLFSAWSWRQDRSGDTRLERRVLTFSGIGAVVYGVTVHFTAIDWGMSLQPEFPSTIWGPLFVAGQCLSALALAIVGLAWAARREPLRDLVSLKALNDLGSLLFALLVMWSYMVWFQFMIVWIANLPQDVVWYRPLERAGWKWVGLGLLIFHFAIPFFLLLIRAVKQRIEILASVAALILLMQLVYHYFQVMPLFHADGIGQHWIDFFTPIAVGGLWLAAFLYTWQHWPVLPMHDRNVQKAMHLRELDEEEAAREETLVHG